MERKLIKHGMSSLTLALPIKWIKERGLTKGDSLKIKEEGNKLIISSEETLKIERISVDIEKLDRTSIILYIQSLYRFGYNEIEINFKKQKAYHYRTEKFINISSVIQKIVNRLVGAEIIEQTKNRILIKNISKEADEDFKVILRRAFLLLNETADTLLEGIRKKDFDLISTVEQNHDNINKFVSYCIRLLNKYGYPDVKKTGYYSHIIPTIDKVVDVLKYNARDILKNKKDMHVETIKLLEKINKSIHLYYKLFYDFSYEIVDELSKNRDHVKMEIMRISGKIQNQELILITNQKQILEIILDLTDFRMGLEY